MKENGYRTLILRRTASLAWITSGATTYVNTANGEGPVTAIITSDRRILLTNTIEGPRLVADEHLEESGWEIITAPWYEGAPSISTITGLQQDDKVTAADVPFALGNGTAANKGAAISRLRSVLLPVEQDRFQRLGAECAEVMHTAATAVQPGQTEFEIAGHLWAAAQPRESK
jgi:Xaa-Pro aminopeptidase